MAAKNSSHSHFIDFPKMALELLRPMPPSATTSGSQIPKDLVQVETEKRIPRNLRIITLVSLRTLLTVNLSFC
jgi:hypothetical protein